ncbi:hypothetical protein [Phormidium nigroviride]
MLTYTKSAESHPLYVVIASQAQRVKHSAVASEAKQSEVRSNLRNEANRSDRRD